MQSAAHGHEAVFQVLAVLFIITAIAIFVIYRAPGALILGMIATVAILMLGWYTGRSAH